MRFYRGTLILALLALTALFCSFAGQTPAPAPTPDVGAIVEATLSAAQTQTAQAVSPTPSTASISGALGYPSSFIPPLRIYAVNPANGDVFKVDTEQNQGTYVLEVRPGTYQVFAYTRAPDGQAGGLAGGYTPAVACGLSVDCTDHTLIPVTVAGGQAVTGIDVKDWYAPEGTFPAPPDAASGQDSIPPLGTVTGTLTYPADALPAMRVALFPLDGSTTSYTDTAAGQGSYSIDLPAGQYHVVAYSLGGAGFPSGLAGGYTQVVPCGFLESCKDHSLIAVTVVAGTTLEDVNPGDWYAPEGTFPPMPGS